MAVAFASGILEPQFESSHLKFTEQSLKIESKEAENDVRISIFGNN